MYKIGTQFITEKGHIGTLIDIQFQRYPSGTYFVEWKMDRGNTLTFEYLLTEFKGRFKIYKAAPNFKLRRKKA